MEATTLIRDLLPQLVRKYGIRTVADVGAGDMNWMSTIEWDADYTPYDLDPYDDRPIKFNCIEQVLPKAYDLVMCMYVMNHFKDEFGLSQMDYIRIALDNFKLSGARYLLATYLLSKEDGSHELQELDEPLQKWYHRETPHWNCFYGLWQLNG